MVNKSTCIQQMAHNKSFNAAGKLTFILKEKVEKISQLLRQ